MTVIKTTPERKTESSYFGNCNQNEEIHILFFNVIEVLKTAALQNCFV